MSWNLQHFGSSKSDKMMDFIARTVSPYDIIAIQEVVGKYGGVKAVAVLIQKLNRNGAGPWKGDVSKITTGSPNQSERYAFVYNSQKVTEAGNGWLDPHHREDIIREPFMATFSKEGKVFTLVSFHAVPKKRNPEHEIKYLKYFPGLYPGRKLIFLGDFNTPQSNDVFNPLKKIGYLPALKDQKTTLKMDCDNGDCLASSYDNFFFNPAEIQKASAKIIPFYTSFADMVAARKLSDHVPVVFTFSVR